jgi:hypothetical protein
MPGQNTPATTTMATVEQGMKVFTAVYKRLYRALKEEFIKIARLNELYLNPNTMVQIVEMPINPEDFKASVHTIVPSADPTAVSQTEKLLKAQGLMELLPTGILDPVKVVTRVLDAQEQPNWQELIKPEVAQSGQVQSPPDPKMLELQMKGQLEGQKIQMQGAALQHKMELEAHDKQVQLAMSQQEHAQNMQQSADMANIKAAEAIHKQRVFSATEQAAFIQSLMHKHVEHQQKMQHNEHAAAQQAKKPLKGAK